MPALVNQHGPLLLPRLLLPFPLPSRRRGQPPSSLQGPRGCRLGGVVEEQHGRVMAVVLRRWQEPAAEAPPAQGRDEQPLCSAGQHGVGGLNVPV